MNRDGDGKIHSPTTVKEYLVLNQTVIKSILPERGDKEGWNRTGTET